MPYRASGSLPHNGKGGNTLTVRDPKLNSILVGRIGSQKLAETSQVGNRCLRDFDNWSQTMHGGSRSILEPKHPYQLTSGSRPGVTR